MKRLFALALMGALLLSCLVGCTASAAGNDAAILPFCGLGGTEEYSKDLFPNLANYCRINVGISYAKVSISMPGCGSDLDKIAAAIKQEMDARPPQMRYLQVFGTSKAFDLGPKDGIYLDYGVDQLKEVFSTLMEKYHAIGGKLTGVILDLEYVDLGSFYLSRDLEKDSFLFHRIVTNPLYATEVRPLLAERGFYFWPNPSIHTPEIYAVYTKSGSEYANSRDIWDTVMRIRLNRYQDEAISEPVWKYFPDALINDYQSTDMYAWYLPRNDSGLSNYRGGNKVKAGNVSNYSSYATRPAVNLFYDKNSTVGFLKPDSYNRALYPDTPFYMLLWDTNLFKHMYASTDTEKISACICAYDYNAKREGSVSNTPYYTENLFHLGLLDPQPFRLYVYHKDYDTNADYLYRLSIISQVLSELTRVAGFADRKPIPVPTNWNTGYVLSGMYAGGRNIWRITPDTNQVSLDAFRVEGTDPTFRVGGQTVTFPGGRILEDGKIDVVGTCGYWVETDANVTPVVTSDADRFAKTPALQVDFADHQVGPFNHNTALPARAWEFTQGKKSAAQILDVEGNRLLAIYGDYSLRNVLLPRNVTAGDNYALRQIWSVAVTVAEDPAAEIVLLDYAGKKQDIADGGFRITGGKLYYSENGEYKELTTLSAGSYTLRREMDFSNGNAYVCKYLVYDAGGNLLQATENVPIPTCKLPVTSIGFACKNAAEQVLLDDYTLWVAGAAADFSLFDAATGIEVADITQPRDRSTAYRLSWLNATEEASTKQVVAAVYAGDQQISETVVKQLQMAPGCDGVETGIVEVAQGQTVKVFLRDAPIVTESQQDSGKNLTPIVILAAVIVAAVGAVVVVLLLPKRPKPQP